MDGHFSMGKDQERKNEFEGQYGGMRQTSFVFMDIVWSRPSIS
jgi:hypothetical protein